MAEPLVTPQQQRIDLQNFDRAAVADACRRTDLGDHAAGESKRGRIPRYGSLPGGRRPQQAQSLHEMVELALVEARELQLVLDSCRMLPQRRWQPLDSATPHVPSRPPPMRVTNPKPSCG